MTEEPRLVPTSRLVDQAAEGLGRRYGVSSTASREKRSVTLSAAVAAAVDEHVARGAAASFSAALDEAATLWAANQDLRLALDDLYAADPAARPSAATVDRAAQDLGLT